MDTVNVSPNLQLLNINIIMPPLSLAMDLVNLATCSMAF